MEQPFAEQIAATEAAIARLSTQKDALKTQRDAPWPKRLRVFAYCSKDTNWDTGATMGLTGAARRLFAQFEEIPLDCKVAQDGVVTILACDGRSVAPRPATSTAVPHVLA